jgi:hypothetical protein
MGRDGPGDAIAEAQFLPGEIAMRRPAGPCVAKPVASCNRLCANGSMCWTAASKRKRTSSCSFSQRGRLRVTCRRKPKLQAVLFDWAGTTIDYGSRAPVEVFLEIFHRRDVEITQAEARGPMGRAKRDHIAELLQLPRVAQAWHQRYGSQPGDADAQAMYDEFLPCKSRRSRAGPR